jgi:hypothetical protein
VPLDPQFRVALDLLAATGMTPLVRGTAQQTKAEAELHVSCLRGRRGPRPWAWGG